MILEYSIPPVIKLLPPNHVLLSVRFQINSDSKILLNYPPRGHLSYKATFFIAEWVAYKRETSVVSVIFSQNGWPYKRETSVVSMIFSQSQTLRMGGLIRERLVS